MEELAYCVPLGLPHSEFLSWDEDDQDKALEYISQQKTVCEGCGTREETWENDQYAYVSWAKRCPGCELLDQEKDNWTDRPSSGIRIMLVPREWAEREISLGNYGS